MGGTCGLPLCIGNFAFHLWQFYFPSKKIITTSPNNKKYSLILASYLKLASYVLTFEF